MYRKLENLTNVATVDKKKSYVVMNLAKIPISIATTVKIVLIY